jgi:hypothetical protein
VKRSEHEEHEGEKRSLGSAHIHLGNMKDTASVTGLRRTTIRFDVCLQGFAKAWSDWAKSSKVTLGYGSNATLGVGQGSNWD